MPKSSKARTGTSKTAKRRDEIRRSLPRPSFRISALLQEPEYFRGLGLVVLCTIILALLMCWSRDQVKIEIGQVMRDTRITRLDYTVEDTLATETRRAEARAQSPRIYRLNQAYLDELSHALVRLPSEVAGVTELSEVSPEIIEQYRADRPGARRVAAVFERQRTRQRMGALGAAPGRR
jgi:membrane-associated HD superfamily phosphohydrolase